MQQLHKVIDELPVLTVNGQAYLSYQAVTDTVAAFLFPDLQPDQIDETPYRKILETADSLCHDLGYTEVVKLTPPEVSLSAMRLYWTAVPETVEEPFPIIHVGPGRAEMLAAGLLLDARISQLGLDDVTGQHFKIPVTASEAVLELMGQAVASDWPNDYRGIWKNRGLGDNGRTHPIYFGH